MEGLLPIYNRQGGGVVFVASNSSRGNTATFYWTHEQPTKLHDRVLEYLQDGFKYVYFMKD
jgi:hypothetical protein